MPHFYLPAEPSRGDRLLLEDREAHHARHVLRIRKGDRVSVLDGNGTERLCEVREVSHARIELAVLDQHATPPPPWRVTLLQAVPKGKVFESIIQKATELGAYRVVPLLSERVAIRLDEVTAPHKLDKWRLTAIEAIKQCGARWLPEVESAITPAQFLARQEPFDLALIASLQPGSRSARECFAEFAEHKRALPRTVALWVGPEGDFSPDEVAAVLASGAWPITLGRLVLRCETAAVYCLSILHHELTSAHWPQA